ncbi:MAG: DUF4279 domain-containing protein [Deltaproteobacteria bacterium]|nr:DUF4279 domain-containing protein [Deltaproteobacteria bacterium]
MNTETFVSLTIVSSMHRPEDINSLVGVHCDRSWKIGDLRAKTTIKEKDNGWILNSGLKVKDSLSEHMKALLEKIAPISSKIQTLSSDNYVEISCAIYAKEPPSLHFEKDTIHRINQLGASLDIDLYII